MNINNQLTNEYGNLKGYNIMIGNTKVLNEYSNGKINDNYKSRVSNIWFYEDEGFKLYYKNFNKLQICFIGLSKDFLGLKILLDAIKITDYCLVIGGIENDITFKPCNNIVK